MRAHLQLLALGVAVGGVAAAPAPSLAEASTAIALPTPRLTVIKPNLGIGGLSLDRRVGPWPNGWKRPLQCAAVSGLSGCIWATRHDAVPLRGQIGIRGPYVIATAHQRRLVGLAISTGGRNADVAPLRNWRTTKGIGFTSTLEEFKAAYPGATLNESAGSYRLSDGSRRTVFVFRAGVLTTIAMVLQRSSRAAGG